MAPRDFYSARQAKGTGKEFFYCLLGFPEYYTVPDDSIPIKEKVGYDGVAVHVYIWMEGTDADCVNGKSVEDDPSTYDVTVKLAGVASGN